jgi:hypothetical protein
LLELPRLLSATERIAEDDDGNEDLRLLLAPGSSLGGARPKASIRDQDGTLAIAKFPQKDDDLPVVSWEALALRPAAKAGIAVPDWRIEQVGGKPVLVLRRFDRAAGNRLRSPPRFRPGGQRQATSVSLPTRSDAWLRPSSMMISRRRWAHTTDGFLTRE